MVSYAGTEDMTEKSKNIWFERALIESNAFLSLKTATSHKVLSLFFIRRQCKPIGRKGKDGWIIKNNGQIFFTYEEALKSYGISYGTFRNAIDELIGKGFIDIAASGQGTYKVANLYSISNRWKNYDTPDYETPKPRHKKPINRGFQKGNQCGRNCNKKKSTVTQRHSSTVMEQHSVKVGNGNYVSRTT
jgi:hypothetical protein